MPSGRQPQHICAAGTGDEPDKVPKVEVYMRPEEAIQDSRNAIKLGWIQSAHAWILAESPS